MPGVLLSYLVIMIIFKTPSIVLFVSQSSVVQTNVDNSTGYLRFLIYL